MEAELIGEILYVLLSLSFWGGIILGAVLVLALKELEKIIDKLFNTCSKCKNRILKTKQCCKYCDKEQW